MRKTVQNIERMSTVLQLLKQGRNTCEVVERMKAGGHNVSRRTVERYMHDLRSIGVHIEWNPDRDRFDVGVSDYTRNLMSRFI